MNNLVQIQNLIYVIRGQRVMLDRDLARLTELEHYFIQHCKDNQSDIRELREAMDLLIDRTKPSKIGFKTD